MHAIEIRGLTKIYKGGVVALKNLEFVYDRDSSIIVLLGPNGAGKTTLLRILAGQLRPTRGVARIFGCDVTDHDRIVRLVSFLPQDVRAPFYNLTPFDYVFTYLLMRGYSVGDARRRAREMIEYFGLQEYANKPVSKLSGGMVRRALIAAVLADENARLYLLDEPLPGLDPLSRVVFWSALRKLVGSGKLAIVSSHYTEDIPFIADYVLVLNKGVKITEGDVRSVVGKVLGDCRYKVVVRVAGSGVDPCNILVELRQAGVCKIVRLADDVIVAYVRSPTSLSFPARDASLDVRISPVSLSDVVIALGEEACRER